MYPGTPARDVADFVQGAAAATIGIGPALAAVFLALRRYDRPHFDHTLFDDRRVFLALAVGFVFGTIGSAVAAFAAQPDPAGAFVALFLVAVLEEAFKLVYLNRKGYRARFDTTYVGVALGGGVAATSAFVPAYRAAAFLGDPLTAGFLLVFSLSLATLHVFTGSLIGFGCAFGATFPRLAWALLARAIYLILAMPFVLAAGSAVTTGPVVALAAGLALSLFLYRFALVQTLPDAVPADVRNERRRRARAKALKQ